MKAEARRRAEIKVKRGARWTGVHAEAEGKDVSHLGYAPRRLQLGSKAVVQMAGIGGVGTDPAFRRRGLARQVFARAMEEIQGEGYSSVGLYTSAGIVAHRLYRRFGLVDISRRRPAYKLLDPGRFACEALQEMLGEAAELRARRPTLRFDLHPYGVIHVRVEASEVRLLARAPRKINLSLNLSGETFVALWERDIGLPYAETAGLVEWEGDAEVYGQLKDAWAAWRRPVNEE